MENKTRGSFSSSSNNTVSIQTSSAEASISPYKCAAHPKVVAAAAVLAGRNMNNEIFVGGEQMVNHNQQHPSLVSPASHSTTPNTSDKKSASLALFISSQKY